MRVAGSEITRRLVAEIDPWAEACLKNDYLFYDLRHNEFRAIRDEEMRIARCILRVYAM
ncbi:hypothetical protein NYE69_02600 [Paenibacillus sp. FSL R5-0527]|uniref:hypothetical protein n=1 Tax=Paenibacillus sp. FSL R5-0527 TaxID=2975321 RepID=UPI0030F930C8